jgi:hypothetical protein
VLSGCVDTSSFRCDMVVVGSAPGCEVTRPTCTGFSWIVEAVACRDTILSDSCAGISGLVVDPSAEPPQARMRAGEAALLQLKPLNPTPPGGACAFDPGGLFPWISSEPAVARTERTTINTYVVIRAVSPGDAHIFADGVSTPGGPIRASLAYCPDAGPGAVCAPIPLVLRVLP